MAAKKKIKVQGPIERRWHYANVGEKLKIDWGLLIVNVAIPFPIPNPFYCTVTVTGCNNPTVTASLTDGAGDETPGTVTADPPPPPPPSSSEWSVNFPSLPGGDYTLSVQVQCDGTVVNQSQDITLPDPSSDGSTPRRVRR